MPQRRGPAADTRCTGVGVVRPARITGLTAVVGLAVSALAWWSLGWEAGVLLAGGVTVGTLVALRRGRRIPVLDAVPAPRPSRWEPRVEHAELPAPQDDPMVPFPAPALDPPAARIPLDEVNLSPPLRMQLDAFGLGLAKRVLDAPNLLGLAATESGVWPSIEGHVRHIFAAADSRGVAVDPRGIEALSAGLAECVARGILLAEWHVRDQGATAAGPPRVPASIVFALARIAEVMEKRLYLGIITTFLRRDAAFEPYALVHFAVACGFYSGLRPSPWASAAAS